MDLQDIADILGFPPATKAAKDCPSSSHDSACISMIIFTPRPYAESSVAKDAESLIY